MAQQTAVEWLESKLKETYQKEGHLPLGYILYLTEQAKKIENKQREEEILNAIIFSEKEHFSNSLCYPTQYVVKKAEKYYNETYNTQNK